MNIINIGLLFVFGINLFLAILIWRLNPKHKINISFSLSVLLLSFWTFGVAMFAEAQKVGVAYFWTVIQDLCGALMVVPFFLFSIYFPYQNYQLKEWQKILIAISIVGIIIDVVVPGFWTESIIIKEPFNDYILNKYGVIYFALFFYTYILLAFYNLLKKFVTSSGYIKKQLIYILVSTGIIAFFGSIFGVIVPIITLKNGPVWIGPYFSLFMVVFLFHFIFRKNS